MITDIDNAYRDFVADPSQGVEKLLRSWLPLAIKIAAGVLKKIPPFDAVTAITEAGDLVQEAACTLIKRLEKDPGFITVGIGPWTYTTIWNLRLSEMKKIMRRKGLIESVVVPFFYPRALEADSQVLFEEIIQIIDSCLTASQKEELFLHLQGYNDRDISEQLGIQYDQVRKRRQRATSKVRSVLSRSGYTNSPRKS